MDISRIKHLAEVGAITQTQLVEYYENHPEELQKLTESDLFGLGLVTRIDDQEVKDSISDPSYSVFKISSDFDGVLTVGQEKTINVSLSPVSISKKGYQKCVFKFDSIRPVGANITFKATDSAQQDFSFTNTGTWGPAEGFPVSADYSATTSWKVSVDQPGKYDVTIILYDNDLGVEVTSCVITANAKDVEKSVYVISSDALSQAFKVGEPTTTNVSLTTEKVGDVGYDKVRFYFESERPEGATLTFKATDSEDEDFTFENEGTWGPEGGFQLPADYSATTPWEVTPSIAGHYKVSIFLKNEEDASVISEYSYEFDTAADDEIVVDDGQ